MFTALLLALIPSVKISVFPGQVLNRFVPIRALGAGVDGREAGNAEETFRPHNLRAMLSSGLGALTYRLRTELAGEAWHWNPEGTWSDAAHRQGYWTSSAIPSKPIQVSWGYRLPRRGNTFDQANDDSYSRIDDGDGTTYWKSNPYLGDAPQWVVIDLGRRRKIDAIRIQWANPFATQYNLEYWIGNENIEEDDNPPGVWHPISGAPSPSFGCTCRTRERGLGVRESGRAGLESSGPPDRPLDLVRFQVTPPTRFIRLNLARSSRTSEPSMAPDPRDRVGFAIREVQIGRMRHGQLRDFVVHAPNHDQTAIYTSSTDPWHRAQDLDRRTEQPGFDTVLASGLTHGLPMLVPVGALYDTPENAEAELRWLKAKGIRLRGVEIGEEPDGQYANPKDFAALYAEIARRARAVFPDVPIGGPSMQTVQHESIAFPPGPYEHGFVRRFMDELRRRGQLRDFQFFSFEWYPFDDPYGACEPQLRASPGMLEAALNRLCADGLPKSLPYLITEYGYSAFAGPSEVQVAAALLNLDTVGKFLELGGSEAYLYGFEPNELISETKGHWGNLMTWLNDEGGNAKWAMPAHWAAALVTREWCGDLAKPHHLVRSTSSSPDVSAYTLLRPEGGQSVLLVNKGRSPVEIVGLPAGRVALWGSGQYAWQEAGDHGHPTRDLPPTHFISSGRFVLPAFSAAVVASAPSRRRL
ncbi:discoidin domain-containing protein [Fimbriimonas ginsengisoli]|uniref:Cellulase n=1 Tax=Fimbriimonas ginsengisoli Gsoil 348 TaxID=661478 RepID=A0A068NT62_FIMGI|nr:discoidin domain-containing protein [Fimbriimonas ginsengisoli]AIE84819.1 Cellulase precursor [Fimbriimonas ginsengisoli Gsoil 348]